MKTMTTTFIDTNALPRRTTAHGEVTEILNEELGPAKNVFGMLRWLRAGEEFTTDVTDKHQLIYLMEGSGNIRLDGEDRDISRGGGVYLGPYEAATVRATAGTSVKLFHLIVRKTPA